MNYDNIPLLRQEIQNITREIIRLCGKRQKKITSLGDLKKLHGVDIRNHAVESYLRTIVIQESYQILIYIKNEYAFQKIKH